MTEIGKGKEDKVWEEKKAGMNTVDRIRGLRCLEMLGWGKGRSGRCLVGSNQIDAIVDNTLDVGDRGIDGKRRRRRRARWKTRDWR